MHPYFRSYSISYFESTGTIDQFSDSTLYLAILAGEIRLLR